MSAKYTMVEKILAAHAKEGSKVAPGENIWIKLDYRTARDFGGANVVKAYEKHYPGEEPVDKDNVFFTFDCVVPANNIPYATNQQKCRDFARKHGLRLHDVDRGIGSHVAMEEGIAVPGVTLVGTDSHLNILGAVGAFGQGMGDQDIAFAFRTGQTWFEVPPSYKFTVDGKIGDGTSAKDIVLHILSKIGSSGALGASVEYEGTAIDEMPLHGRITIASMATEMGAVVPLFEPNAAVRTYCRKRYKGAEKFPKVRADSGAKYEKTMEFNVDGLEPLVAKPPSPENVVPAKTLKDVRIDSAFIGSCTNGTFEDIKAVASICEGRTVAKGVMAKVVPATREVYARMLKSRILNDLFEAGWLITSNGCGGCASGQVGMTGEGEVQISTTNRNFPGKQGAGNTYLASPETVAASALMGRIATVQEVGQ